MALLIVNPAAWLEMDEIESSSDHISSLTSPCGMSEHIECAIIYNLYMQVHFNEMPD